MPTRHVFSSRITLSRRAAIGGLGAAAALELGQPRPIAGQAAEDLSGHPLVGTWLVMTPDGIVPNTFAADGSVLIAFAPAYIDPELGLTLQGPALGRWEADGERRGHFTVVQALSDAAGTYVGTFQFEGFPEVSADGLTFDADTPQRVIIRDAKNQAIIDQVVPSPPVTATRMSARDVVFPAPLPVAATPEV